MNKFVPNRKYIAIQTFFEPVRKSFAPVFRAENRIPFNVICPWDKFRRFIIILVIILKSKVDFFVRKFLEIFNFFCASSIKKENF